MTFLYFSLYDNNKTIRYINSYIYIHTHARAFIIRSGFNANTGWKRSRPNLIKIYPTTKRFTAVRTR